MTTASKPAWIVLYYNKNNLTWMPLLSMNRCFEVFDSESDAKFYASSIRKSSRVKCRVAACKISVEYNRHEIKE